MVNHILHVLFPYIVFFYLFDCFILVKTYQAGVFTHFGQHYNRLKKGLRFLGILPFTKLYLTHTRPIFLSTDHIFIWKESNLGRFELFRTNGFHHIALSDIKGIRHDSSQLSISKKDSSHNVSVDCYSSYLARQLCHTLTKLKQTVPAKRKPLIAKILDRHSAFEQIKKKQTDSPKLFFALECLGMFLFMDMFMLAPLVLYFDFPLDINRLMLLALAIYLCEMGLCLIYVHKRYRYLNKTLSTFFTLLFSPVTAIHAISDITKYDLDHFDDMAIYAATLDPDEFSLVLKLELKRIHFSKQICDDMQLEKGLTLREKYLMKYLPVTGLKARDIFMPPEKKDPQADSYCPLCEVEYIQGIFKCPDCDIELNNYRQAN